MTHEDEALLDWFRSRARCEICCCTIRGRAEPHHTFRHRGMDGGSRLDIAINLCAVCNHCHRVIHDSMPMKNLAKRVVAARHNTTVEAIEDKINEILRTPKGTVSIEELLGELR